MQNHAEQQKERIRELETEVQDLRTRIEDSRAERERTLAPYRERFPKLFKSDIPPNLACPVVPVGPEGTWSAKQTERLMAIIVASLRRRVEAEQEPSDWPEWDQFTAKVWKAVIELLDKEFDYLYGRQDRAFADIECHMAENPDADRDQVEREHLERYLGDAEMDRVGVRDQVAKFLADLAESIRADDPFGTRWQAEMDDPQAVARRGRIHEEARQDRSDGE